jgi:hypothetical protein
MRPISLSRVAALAAVLTLGVTAGAAAQTADTDNQAAMPCQPGMMGQGMMGRGMMGQGMMGGMPGMMGQGMMGMRGHMMKMMFAVADTNGDGGLSIEEVTEIHKRIFTKVDADADGKVTAEEMRAFMTE